MRLTASLARLRQWLSAADLARVRCVSGSLGSPSLGLLEQVWDDLALNVDAILHNGAVVNGLLPYERVRAANVEGTRQYINIYIHTIQCAADCLARNKGVHPPCV